MIIVAPKLSGTQNTKEKAGMAKAIPAWEFKCWNIQHSDTGSFRYNICCFADRIQAVRNGREHQFLHLLAFGQAAFVAAIDDA